ncbi:XXYS1_4_G0034080.mRNA.1.CDS.1 [Saccharomyces cerevisiae]|nr:EM14S01-3B_G0031490.mRNA.1.CDS.1 [Saccharomyces cerevisiae]CAD6625363.1 XXYS1_4_G0034080.mRNA.1.CDS.1 [Saccharomyces cerevisiae]CAI4457017.1 AMH_1a_G0018490.mRNA.1.CDS.1 [Saccharomyces cerevisiae]CAI4465764.1 CEI_1a_G0018430.mRNA.1.CDS.1 [Saccharomyces cerevisiae]CAI6657049.1 AMH_1a_G0018490.mRNA.1.CDS.1 [Saccharomyces cerevisiae]
MSVNPEFIADGIDFYPTTPDAAYFNAADGKNKVNRINSNSENLHHSFASGCRRSSLSVDFNVTSSDSEKSEQSCLENNSQEDEYFCDIFSTELELDEISNKATDYSSSNHQFPEQLELHNYKLLNKIGEGAFSRVFKAVGINTDNQAPVAIKAIIKKGISSDDTLKGNDRIQGSSRKKVLNEVAIHKLVSKNNPHCTKFIAFQESANYYYLVSELVTGGEIFDRIVQLTYFSEDLARHVITQVAIAIKHMHYMGIVHRDVKPENLLFEPIPFYGLDGDMQKEDEFTLGVGGGGIGLVKLMDFGLAKKLRNNTAKTPCGTIEYVAPEVFTSKRYSMKVDMWSIGCVLFTLLCGYPPFYEKNEKTLLKKISRGDYEFLAPWWDNISSGAKNAVTHLLEVDPNKRYDIDDFLNDPWLNSYDCLKDSNSDSYASVQSILNDSFDERAETLHSALSCQSEKQDDTEFSGSESSEYIFMTEEDRNLRGSWIGEPKECFTLDLSTSSIYQRRKNKIFFW